MKWVCVCAHWNWCKSFRWPQQGWTSLFPCAAVLHRPHPGPGEGPRSISVPSAQKDVDLRRRGGGELRWSISDFWKHLLPPRHPRRLTRDITSDTLPITGVSWWKRGRPRVGDLQMLVRLLDEIAAPVLNPAGTKRISPPPAAGVAPPCSTFLLLDIC